jgi:hypothetical protein
VVIETSFDSGSQSVLLVLSFSKEVLIEIVDCLVAGYSTKATNLSLGIFDWNNLPSEPLVFLKPTVHHSEERCDLVVVDCPSSEETSGLPEEHLKQFDIYPLDSDLLSAYYGPDPNSPREALLSLLRSDS